VKKKEQEISNMLEYLYKNGGSGGGVSKRENDIYYVEGFFSYIPEDKDRRDYYSFKIDFKNKTVFLYAADISHHKEPHYFLRILNCC
jgi:hypothetical protein